MRMAQTEMDTLLTFILQVTSKDKKKLSFDAQLQAGLAA